MKKLGNFKVYLVGMLIGLCIFSANVYSQEDTDLPEEFGLALGVFKIRPFAEKSVEFENFDRLFFDHFPNENMEKPKMDKKNRVKVIGGFMTTDGTVFNIKEGFLKRNKNGDYQGIELKSVEMNGIGYSFCGNFLKEYIREQGGYTEVIGTLTKYKNGKKIASKEFPFYKYVEEH